jgi:hypothetical protein
MDQWEVFGSHSCAPLLTAQATRCNRKPRLATSATKLRSAWQGDLDDMTQLTLLDRLDVAAPRVLNRTGLNANQAIL